MTAHAVLIFDLHLTGVVHVKALGRFLLEDASFWNFLVHSFIPCSERIHVAVTEMAALFPKVRSRLILKHTSVFSVGN